MRVVARDQGQPQQSSIAMVTVRVARNRFDPVYRSRSYSAVIAKTFTPSLPLISVEATDADQEVCFIGRLTKGDSFTKD